MKSVYVIQHTDAEFLGLMEDHLEGRGIRFRYLRPPVDSGWQGKAAVPADGLVLLGGGPWGTVGERVLPSLAAELSLASDYLAKGLPVIGIGAGAQILAIAAGGGAEPAPLEFSVGQARRVAPDALCGHLPERYPLVIYMRDRPIPPADARILAEDDAGRPALFQVGASSLGFTGHPGTKRGIVEDLVMEFAEAPEDPVERLNAIVASSAEMSRSLAEIMVGTVQLTRWMQPG